MSEDVRLGVLTERVTPELVDHILAQHDREGGRPGALPPRFMVYFVLALALFQQDSYDDVAENLVGALGGMDQSVPNKSSFTRARQRLGAGPLEGLFRALAGSVAPEGLSGSFYRGMRLAAVDGFVLDVPDTTANRAFFGGPSDAKGRDVGFPQTRVVTLTETGTHASIDAAVGRSTAGNRSWRPGWPAALPACWSSWIAPSPAWRCGRHIPRPEHTCCSALDRAWLSSRSRSWPTARIWHG
ncbi:transposase domain-containing protein [Nonomuraea sp. KM90]|uniref:transposase domain-containing protein n=1 Tax=Nonomuraea sp. KM90 TaxID=3457428 RepID=UPI003FCC3B11